VVVVVVVVVVCVCGRGEGFDKVSFLVADEAFLQWTRH